MNNDSAPEGFGHDLLVGQSMKGRHATRLDANGVEIAHIEASAAQKWIVATGGGFFFAPAVSVLGSLKKTG